MTGDHQKTVEIWGGIEYSVARVNNRFTDQLKKSGYDKRPDYIRLFADLGIKTIRFPILWEKVSCKKGKPDFSSVDRHIEKLLKYNITPIAGFVHHGNGPDFTCLSDPNFSEYLAEYAQQVVLHYPFLKYYTPLNEPLTTARFGGLYGIWYPHARDNKTFITLFLNQIKGIILSMKAIREVNSDAELIQTEDLGKIYSSDVLKYQADFENERRWLTYDMLTGKMNSDHPMFKFFLSQGIPEKDLLYFTENYCIPSICGFNHYATSERYLDHNISWYPERFHGGNDIHRYADVEALRSGAVKTLGFEGLLREAWERYHLPVALTEVHIACTREDQLRWFYEAYTVSNKLKNEGIDIRAITAWSLLGSFDWDSLLSEENGHYESGIYDLRSKKPRPTALAGIITQITREGECKNEICSVPGWWKRDVRVLYPKLPELSEFPELFTGVRPILITGASGSLGRVIVKICKKRGFPIVIPGHSELDITDIKSVEKALEKYNPFALINAAGFSKIDKAELNEQLCYLHNSEGPTILAQACSSSNIKLVTFSSDQVFNGKKKNPYTEGDATGPVNIYGKSKVLAEEMVLKNCPDALIIRSSYFFNPWNPNDYLLTIMKNGSGKISHFLPADMVISPTYVPNLVNNTLDLLIDNEKGIWHLSNGNEISISEFVKMAFRKAGLDEKRIVPVKSSKLNFIAPRPKYSALESLRGRIMDHLGVTLNSFISEMATNQKKGEEIFMVE